MAYEGWQMAIDRPAAVDLSSYQHQFVYQDDTGKAAIIAADGARPIGVLQNNPKAGEMANICVIGITKIIADAVLDEDERIAPHFQSVGHADNGKAQVAAAGDYNCGYPLLPASKKDVVASAIVSCINPPLIA